ncbi:hypothetical protein M409DRAFT_21091 [Zasmidium cellare ATCC 36951]|uniref:F-box domain-containing protein n=1 Tax=Zasmidium cellare ATCC 36951 TaxID=1080233 RepID=A0A6A6CSE6_ZASCE|nr:uncharacterized protein M409DRAFT_21091 [Zasmidium cellare ATCC 36951]KAF2169080.1 hypothetical protein M409DRAFT_21091 [Zasmidium cellare ATCC 36951]
MRNRRYAIYQPNDTGPILLDDEQDPNLEQEPNGRQDADEQDPDHQQDSDDRSQAGPACKTLLANHKLVELVFLQLDMRELLVRIQGISRTWKAIIANSDRLQQALFFKPISKRPLTFVKPERVIDAEKAISKSESTSQIPLTGATSIQRAQTLPWETSSSPATPYLTRHMDSALGSAIPMHHRTPSHDLPNDSANTRTVTESSSSANLFRKFTRKQKKDAKKKNITSPVTSNKSSVSLSNDTPRPSHEFRRDHDNWTPRFYPLTEERDLRQQIFEHPLISRTDAPSKKYSKYLYCMGVDYEPSWKKQFLTQPPLASIKILVDDHCEKLDLVVNASDGAGVRFGDVARALRLRGMVFLTYEGREWWRLWRWTEGRAVELLECIEGGVGEGPWSVESDGN